MRGLSLWSVLICSLLIYGTQANVCPNGTLWRPSPGTSFYWDLTPNISTKNILSSNAQVFDFDMFYVTSDMVNLIRSLNRTLLCYIDTTYEPFRPDAYKFTAEVLGKDMDGWPGQKWVDIQSPVVRNIMADRLQMAVNLGCEGIEWDDVDAYSNDNGFNLGPNDQLNFNLYLSNITHNANLSAGLKNDLDQIYILDDYFDWALDEQCYQFKECDSLLPFVKQNKAVFGAEYKGTASKICKSLNSMELSFIRTDLDLHGSSIVPCCQFMNPPCSLKSSWCARAPADYPVYPDDQATSPASRVVGGLFAVAITLASALL